MQECGHLCSLMAQASYYYCILMDNDAHFILTAVSNVFCMTLC